jgi:hypothetical protein
MFIVFACDCGSVAWEPIGNGVEGFHARILRSASPRPADLLVKAADLPLSSRATDIREAKAVRMTAEPTFVLPIKIKWTNVMQ